MHNLNEDNKRALNIIWNASDDYSINPEFKAYDEKGEADLYWNYIIGAVHKYYDFTLLQSFFNYLKTDSGHEFYEELFWIGLEHCAFNKGKNDRPVLTGLRRNYAKRVLKGETSPFADNMLNVIKNAHFGRVLGKTPEISGNALNILNDLEFDDALSTEEIVLRMNQIIKTYFRFNYGQYEIDTKSAKKNKTEEDFQKHTENGDEKLSDSEMKAMNDLYLDSAETSREIYFEELKQKTKKHYRKITAEKKDDSERQYIRKYFGASIISEQKTYSIERSLCIGNHKNCHLHFTRGEFDAEFESDSNAIYYNKALMEQKEINSAHFNANYIKHKNSILKLTNRIRNTMLAYFESYTGKSEAGKLNAPKIWRNIYVNDSRIFTKTYNNDIGNISVDILLDASASQHERQETIAAEGYIIAESFTQCQIPVRVYSFSSLRNYTVINLYRDYDEPDNNNKIFNYKTTGCNRDGLAIRTALYMMEGSGFYNKILIVLSDCKPNDAQSIPDTGIKQEQTKYAGVTGIFDTAFEVKKGVNNGNSILCVFTGEDEDVKTAKKIYGHNFARIYYPERFAEIVGILMQNQLKNL
jgi:hypothetical protein